MIAAVRPDSGIPTDLASVLLDWFGGRDEGSGRVAFRCRVCRGDAVFSSRAGTWSCYGDCGAIGNADQLAASLGIAPAEAGWAPPQSHISESSDAPDAADGPASEGVAAFPLDVFPPALRRYVERSAEALGVPVDMVAVPVLGFAAGAIGNTRALEVKPGWVARCILWLAVVGSPGTGKSPALDAARSLVDGPQQEAWAMFESALAQWEADAARARAEKPPADPPQKPALAHYFTTDATMEALADMLGTSPGLTVLRDELVGWVKSHDAYRKAGDRQNWLSLWAGAPLKVDRRGGGARYVPRPTASVVGGIQPDLIPELAEEAGRADGFFDRLLVAYPVAAVTRWTEASVDAATAMAAKRLFEKLRPSAPPDSPEIAKLSDRARLAFARWFDENATLVQGEAGLAAGCYAKYPGQCASIALVLHCLHHPEDRTAEVGVGAVTGAISIVDYFREHLARVLPKLGTGGPARPGNVPNRAERILARAAGSADGGWVSRTKISEGLGGRTPSEQIAAALASLKSEGRAESWTVETGKRPREEWRLVASEERKYGEMAPVGATNPYSHISATAPLPFDGAANGREPAEPADEGDQWTQ